MAAPGGTGSSGLFRAERTDTLEFEGDIVDPAVPPGFARLQAADEHVLGVSIVMEAGVMVF
jgi:hypothetical protein